MYLAVHICLKNDILLKCVEHDPEKQKLKSQQGLRRNSVLCTAEKMSFQKRNSNAKRKKGKGKREKRKEKRKRGGTQCFAERRRTSRNEKDLEDER